MKKQFEYILAWLIVLIVLIFWFVLLGKSDNIEWDTNNKFIEDNSWEFIQDNYRSKIDTQSSWLEEIDSEF